MYVELACPSQRKLYFNIILFRFSLQSPVFINKDFSPVQQTKSLQFVLIRCMKSALSLFWYLSLNSVINGYQMKNRKRSFPSLTGRFHTCFTISHISFEIPPSLYIKRSDVGFSVQKLSVRMPEKSFLDPLQFRTIMSFVEFLLKRLLSLHTHFFGV